MRKNIKIKVDDTVDVGEISIDAKELQFIYKNIVIKIPCSEPFTPYNEVTLLREKLEKENIVLLINASRIDVWPSAMMSAGYNGYIHEIGKRVTIFVNIFDDVESFEHIGSVAEAKKYSEKWSENFKARLPSYISEDIIWQKHSDNEDFYFKFYKGNLILLFKNKDADNKLILIDGFKIVELEYLPKNWTLKDP